MKKFMSDDFLLNTEVAIKLYNDFAKDLPILDYHCHLSPQQIYENKSFRNATEVWLKEDHYKWRAIRAMGIDESYITGEADDYDKFLKWAVTVPHTIGNPLYHWTHLELRRYFNVETLLNPSTAEEIYEKMNAVLAEKTARTFIEESKVEVICTTDDPTDSLDYHILLKQDSTFKTKVLPSFRPDQALEIQKSSFVAWVKKLGIVADINISSLNEFLQALECRIKFFDEVGCKVSDHALNTVLYEPATEEEVALIFVKALNNEAISLKDEAKYKTFLLNFLGKKYAKYNWAMQYHISANRNNNRKFFENVGADTGHDSINDIQIAEPLTRILDSLAYTNELPKTILYSLNPKDNYVLASLIGSFQEEMPGKMQLGTAWWFNDQKNGMLDQMRALASVGLFSQFIGMLTDSRSFLSYTRHEYFRRLVCDLVGKWVVDGEVPEDYDMLGELIQNICYYNAKKYFNF